VMSDRDEWITAASAVALLGMKHYSSTRTICKRAHVGLIKARAQRFVRDGQFADNVDVPAEFWWAEGEAALNQNWTTGDFDTWINQRIRLQAFGVTFRRSDIEQLRPPPISESASSPGSMQKSQANTPVYQTPQGSDFHRNVVSITQKSEAEAHAERLRITSDAILKGAGRSNRLIIAVIIPFEKSYDKAVGDVAHLIGDYVERRSSTPTELGAIARVELESLADRLLAQLPDAGFSHDAARIRAEYREKFQQRLDGAIRDIEIGLVEGRTIATTATANSESEGTTAKLSDAVTLKPTFMGMSIDLYKAWYWAQDKLRSARRR
jgi:hypothetical protein